MARTPTIGEIALEAERQRELTKVRTNLWYLATRYLDYGWNPKAGGKPFPGKGLVERTHKYICDWYDATSEDLFCGLWMARWHHKTTIVVSRIVQRILQDPNRTMFYFHAVEPEARKVVQEVAWHLKNNMKLRKLEPIGLTENGVPYEVLAKGNYRAGDNFTVVRERYSRFPTLSGQGIFSEITGAHADEAYLDDVVGASAMEDGSVHKIGARVRHTILPVVDGTRLRVNGTPWGIEGPYPEWQRSKAWRTLIVPGSVPMAYSDFSALDFTQRKLHIPPDYTLSYPIYGPIEHRAIMIEKLKLLREEMKGEFAPQILCDPMPSETKPWKSEYERFCTLEEASGPGTKIVLTDPAPAKVGSPSRAGEKKRADGTKDVWTVAVLKVRIKNGKVEFILMDGDGSRSWGPNEGFEAAARMGRRWNCEVLAWEGVGTSIASFERDSKLAIMKTRANMESIQLSGTNRGKNEYFGALCELAKYGQFLISETVPQEFIDDFLFQCRNWMVMLTGESSLRFDDHANVVSMIVDPALEKYIPFAGDSVAPDGDDDYGEDDGFFEEQEHLCRYMGI